MVNAKSADVGRYTNFGPIKEFGEVTDTVTVQAPARQQNGTSRNGRKSGLPVPGLPVRRHRAGWRRAGSRDRTPCPSTPRSGIPECAPGPGTQGVDQSARPCQPFANGLDPAGRRALRQVRAAPARQRGIELAEPRFRRVGFDEIAPPCARVKQCVAWQRTINQRGLASCRNKCHAAQAYMPVGKRRQRGLDPGPPVSGRHRR